METNIDNKNVAGYLMLAIEFTERNKMKRKIKSWWLAVVSIVCWTGAVFAADIRYVADNGGGEYSGSGYGISVSVSAPANGVTIKYAESAMGPWLDELTYKDVCTAKPIYFQILAEGYKTVVDFRTVTITPKPLTSDFVWLVFPSDDYVYDGTAKIPDAACGDGDPSIITDNDFSVSYSDNVNAGTAKATFIGKGNYTGTVEEEFEILKADNEWTSEPTIAGWTYGQAASEPSSAAKNGTATLTYGTAGNPGGLGTSRPTMPSSYVATFTVPESQNYKALSKDVPFTIAKATINYVADGSTGEYCGIGYGITVTVSTPSSGVTVKYSETDAGPWQDNPITFKDVCTDKSIYFQIEAEGYKTVTDSRTVTVTPKTLTSDFVWLVFPPDDYVYDGTAKTPDTACADGVPSIITDNDFTVSYSDNVNAGTAKATFTGKGNYTGTVEEEFEIKKAKLNNGNEPGAGTVPAGGLSKFDITVEYDGAEHTVDAAAILSAWQSINAGVVLGYALGETATDWDVEPETFVNVCATSVWYKVTLANYEDFVKEVKVTITPRTGVVVDIVGNVATNVYNGTAQSVDGYTAAINDPLYKETDFEFVGNSAVSGTVSGKYPMGLIASQFTNKNMNFAGVTFNVTDGELVILEPPQKNVIFDAIGGVFASGSVVTQECEDVYLAFPVATREGYVFDGWYLGVTNGAPKATAGAQLLVDDDHTLFAKWRIDEALMPGGASIFAWEAIDANTARITGFKNVAQKVSTLLLPDMMEGRFVTEITTGAFANSKSGMTKLVLPVFCTKIGDKAFTGVTSLSEIVFADVRRWDAPSEIGSLAIGRYAFSGAGVGAVTLPKSVGSIGDYAFANCRKLTNLTILGAPTVGVMPLRRAGLDVGGVTVHLDPALANDGAYMETLKQECGNVTVRADAVVTRMTLSSLAMSASEIELSVSVEKAASWGKVDVSRIKVAYRESLSDEPIMLDPSSVTENADGSLTVKVVAPKGNSGFFQVVLEK